MLGKSVVFFLVEFEGLLGVAFLHARNQLVLLVLEAIHPVNAEEILVMPDIELVGGVEEAFAEREVINRVEDVGLPCPIEADKTIHLLRKRQVGGLAVLEIGQSQFFQVHQNLLRSMVSVM